MPGVYLTRRPFGKIAEDIVDIVSHIDLDWFTDARWLQQKDVVIDRVSARDYASICGEDRLHCLLIVLEICFLRGNETREGAELYNVPLVICTSDNENGAADKPLVAIKGPGYEASVYDATTSTSFARAVLNEVKREARVAARRGFFEFHAVGPGVPGEVHIATRLPETSTNTLVTIDSSQIMKVYRRMVPGVSPDLEMSVHLTTVGFRHIPAATGYAVYRTREGGLYPLLLIQEFVPNRGEAWQVAFADAMSFLCGARGRSQEEAEAGGGGYLARLGAITADLHRASARIDDDAFQPEPLRPEDAADLAGRLAGSISQTMEALRRDRGQHGPATASKIREAAGHEPALRALVERACGVLISSTGLGKSIRLHGDLHLGQFLRTDGGAEFDFVVIDFEGEPLRPAEERRQKSSPLRDVAGMLRSFDYAGYLAALDVLGAGEPSLPRGVEGASHKTDLVERARAWARRAGETFLAGYLGENRGAGSLLLPDDARDLRLMLTCFKLEKALYEVRYELGNRPHWVEIPLAGVLDCLGELRALVDSPGC
ncbi:MAG: hypothetical protein AB1774_04285 [Bacillota bacterium]